MKLSEYIAQLQTLLATNGDLDVMAHNMCSTVCGACRPAHAASIKHLAIISKRERTARLYSTSYDAAETKGTPVVML